MSEKQRKRGTIPACAGEPWTPKATIAALRDYPRVCGGTHGVCFTRALRKGLSPRVRGNHLQRRHIPVECGTIPACAGEPTSRRKSSTRPWDYPRVCGGTVSWTLRTCANQGLSPRVRGNRRCGCNGLVGHGTIPACAGEPYTDRDGNKKSRDYPRVCGGTFLKHRGSALNLGLSPRVRGNLHQIVHDHHAIGTIPACAGEPKRTRNALALIADYPRVCGGTKGRGNGYHATAGLSPRVRGNRRFGRLVAIEDGTIPACAGEPRISPTVRAMYGDYPRVCGGTASGAPTTRKRSGLSPRVRGNLALLGRGKEPPGTIPACAGEPTAPDRGRRRRRDYPRVCGGTRLVILKPPMPRGLSPRVRGNLTPNRAAASRIGTIPACAGEPAVSR